MLLLLTLTFFCFTYESCASYDDCKEQNGKEIVLDVCVPDRYGNSEYGDLRGGTQN